MSAELTVVSGRAGCGKSRMLRRYAASLACEGEAVYFIVPEQFTFETERALAEETGNGLFYTVVCSFTSLATRVLRASNERRPFLSKQGRLMILRKCAEENAQRLTAFARVSRRPGFAAECDSFFTQLKRFEITPEALAEKCALLEDGSPLKNKLGDLSLLYSASEDHLKNRGMDAEDAFTALVSLLPSSEIAGKEVVIDGFDLISEQIYDIISTLLDICPKVTLALRECGDSARDLEVFASDERILSRVLKMADDKGLNVKRVRLDGSADGKSPMLAHIEHEGFAYPYFAYEGEYDGGIRVFAGTDTRAEAEAVADAVIEAREAGFRYRDMAIIASDVSRYIELVTRALKKRGIPFFTDAKRPLASYSASRLTVAALRAACLGFSAGDVLELIKTGLLDIDERDADEFENFVLMRGIRGRRFTDSFPSDATDGAKRARDKAIPPLMKLAQAMSASSDAKSRAAALYDYIIDIGLREKLVSLANRLKEEGRLELMEETAQVFNMIVELISQLHAILGDAPVAKRRFIAVYEEGLASYDVGVIPTTADQVLVGSLGRSRARDLEALFVLGAAANMFPTAINDDSMINDEEREKLNSLGLTKLPDTLSRNEKELSDVYGAVTKPRRLLYLSYTAGGGGAPSALVDRIAELYPKIKTESDITRGDTASLETAFSRLCSKLRLETDEVLGVGENESCIYSRFRAFESAGGEWSARTGMLRSALFSSVSPSPINSELNGRLFGKRLFGSASRLETYGACPFLHMARYGLKLMPRKEYREKPLDEGAFCHEILSRFTSALVERGYDMKRLTEADADDILDTLIPESVAEHNGGVLMATARNRALLARLVRKIKATAHAVVRQLAAGRFSIYGSEVSFGEGTAFPPLALKLQNGASYVLSGRIDRLDTYKAKHGEEYFRVVDYKTGNAGFDIASVVNGLRLQLPLYATAIAASERVGQTAGMYYQKVTEPFVKDTFDAERALINAFRLDGLTLDIEELREASGGSEAIPIKNSGKLVNAEGIKKTADSAMKSAARAAEGISLGECGAYPARERSSGRTSCERCEMDAVCGFDDKLNGCAYRKLERVTLDSFFKGEKNVDE